MTAKPIHDFKVGDVIHGFCGGVFGRGSYACRRVEAVGPDWIVTRNGLGEDPYLDVEMVAGRHIPTRAEAADTTYCYVHCDGPETSEVAR